MMSTATVHRESVNVASHTGIAIKCGSSLEGAKDSVMLHVPCACPLSDLPTARCSAHFNCVLSYSCAFVRFEKVQQQGGDMLQGRKLIKFYN